MTWFIELGDDIERDKKIKFTFYRSIDENYKNSDLIFHDVLYECQDK